MSGVPTRRLPAVSVPLCLLLVLVLALGGCVHGQGTTDGAGLTVQNDAITITGQDVTLEMLSSSGSSGSSGSASSSLRLSDLITTLSTLLSTQSAVSTQLSLLQSAGAPRTLALSAASTIAARLGRTVARDTLRVGLGVSGCGTPAASAEMLVFAGSGNAGDGAAVATVVADTPVALPDGAAPLSQYIDLACRMVCTVNAGRKESGREREGEGGEER